MFRPKKHLKLDLLKSKPSINDLQKTLEHARKLRGSTIELPWDLEEASESFALAVRIEVGSEEALWTLYTGHKDESRVLWSAPFSDIDLLSEVISLSLAEATTLHNSKLSSKSPSTDLAQPEQKAEIEKDFAAETKDAAQETLSNQENYIAPPQQQSLEQNTNYVNLSQSQANMPAQNFYPNLPSNSGTGFPSLTPPNTQAPIQYVYYYPGYPYPIPMPYPPNPHGAQPVAGSVPLQQGLPVLDPNTSSSRLPTPDIELLRKKTNHMIGQFLVGSGLIPETTLRTALKLQEMVVGNVISAEQAYEAINKFHNQGGNLDVSQLIKDSTTSGNILAAPKQSYPLLGDLLVKAQIISRSLLEAVLKMQEIVRAGAISKDEACQAIIKELARTAPKNENSPKAQFERELRVMDLLVRCSLISVSDKETALNVQKKHGGQLGQILVSAGKLHLQTYSAALDGDTMLRQNKIKLEQAIIALNYCTRTRMNLSEAVKELGFFSGQ